MVELEDVVYEELVIFSEISEYIHVGYYDNGPHYTIPISTLIISHYSNSRSPISKDEIHKALVSLWGKGLIDFEFFCYKEDPEYLFVNAKVLTARDIACK